MLFQIAIFSKTWSSSLLFYSAEAYSEPCQASKMKHFGKNVNSLQFLNSFAKSSILDVWQESEYSSAQ